MARVRTMKFFGMLLLLSLCLGLQVQAQLTIRGKVIDVNDKTPLAGVTVAVGTETGGLTDDKGQYSLTVKAAPIINILFRYDGQDSTIALTTVSGQNEYTVDVSMGQKADITLDVTVITAGKHAENLAGVPTSMDVIGQKKVDMQISSRIEDALQQNSGVDIIDGQPNIRGSSGYAYGAGSRVMVMLDGLPLLSPDAQYAQFDLIPTDNIGQIEVMKGASSVLYGSSALGGVINVIMADAPETPKTSIRLRGAAYGSPADKSLDWDSTKSAMNAGINIFHSRKIGRHDLVLLGDYWRDSGWRYGTGGQQGRAQIMTKFRPKAIPGMTWGVNASAKFDSSTTFLFWDSYYAVPSDSNPYFIPFASSDTVFQSYGAYSGVNSARSQLNSRYAVDPYIKYLTKKNNVHSYRGRYMKTINTNDTGQGSSNSMWYNDYQYTTTLWDQRVTWVSGATASFNYANGDSLYGGSHRAINTAVYSQMDAKLTSKLNASIGGRFDNWNVDKTRNDRAPIGRAGLNYEITKGTNVRASFGQAFRSPSIAERFTNTFASGLVIAPNPDLLVEKGYSAEVGFRQGFLAGNKARGLLGYFDAAAFMMDYNNMIEFGVKTPDVFSINPSPVFTAKNYAHARTTGIEATAMVQITYDKFRFDFNGGVTYTNPVNLNPAPDSLQVDLYGTLGPQQQPFNGNSYGMLLAMLSPSDFPGHRTDNPAILKYRSKWLNRFSATAGYGRFAVTCNYRYKSRLLGIDQFLYVAIPGSADWVRTHDRGYGLVDFIVSAQITKGLNIALSAKNAFNVEYAVLPGIIGEQHNYNFQLKYVF